MATFDLGRVTPLYKGDYSASASYELNDVVLYNGSLFWHVQATATVGILPTDTTVWKLAFADEGVRAEIRGYADNAQASADSALASKSAAATSASNASASASQAALSAQSASTKASEASTSAQTASAKASESSASAQSAASSAQTATDKATLASQKAAAASESASLAIAKASAAATSETNAVTAAQTATTKASEAQASATSAQEYDESAQQSAVNAQTAQGLAETAQTGAETAQGLAEDARDEAQEIVDGINAKASQIDANTESIASLENDCYKPYAVDTASGAVVSFMDGADDIPLKSLVVNIDPVQDLHGQDGPYPAGGGKNLLDPSLLIDQIAWNTIPIYAPAGTVLTMSNNQPASETSGLLTHFRTPGGTQGSSTTVSVGHPVTQTVGEEGYLEVVQRNRDSIKSYADYEYQIEVGSTATAYAPYENICPISGWTGCEVQHDGKNLLTYVPNKITAPLSVTLDKSRATLVKKGITYTMSFDMQNATTWRICAILFDLEGNRHFVNDEYPFGIVNPYLMPNASGQYYVWGGNYTFKSFVITPIDDFYVMFFFLLGDTSASTIMVNPMLEVGSTATSYEPYKGANLPINWQTEAGTVYGGHLDVLSGVLTVDMAMVDLGTLTWMRLAAGDNYVFYTTDISKAWNFNFLCSQYANSHEARQRMPDKTCGVTNTTMNVFCIRDDIYTEDDVFKTAMSGVQLCYELATPITIQLTPHDVKTLLGQNNIFADTGDTSVEYRADTKLYIERLTEPDADMVADANIVSGSYFMVGNTLYKATANIASGSAVIEGTNATRKSLSEALNEINQ